MLTAGYLLTLVVLALEIPLALNVDRRATSEFQSGVLGNAALAAAQVSDLVAAGRRGAALTSGRGSLHRIIARSAETTGARVIVIDRRGRVLTDSTGTADLGAPYATSQRPELSVALSGGRVDVRSRFSDSLGQELQLVTVPVVDNGAVVGAVRVSEPLGQLRDRIHRSWLGLGIVGTAVVLTGLVLAWILATSLVRPVQRLRDAAVSLGRGNLAARADARGPKEVATLARSFNTTADALSANLTAQQEFLANASHQLRTPLTGIKLRLEAIREEGGPASLRAAKAEEELQRLEDLVEDLLKLATASSVEAGGTSIDLADAARQAVPRWEEVAASTGKRLSLAVNGPCVVHADEADLANILDNLVENAIRYSEPSATVTIAAKTTSDGSRYLSVSDTGPGIPPEERGRVFERFYRGRTGHSAGPGSGLGLAIVAHLAGRWRGEVRAKDEGGTRIEVTFPPPPTVS